MLLNQKSFPNLDDKTQVAELILDLLLTLIALLLTAMHTIANLAKALNRTTLVIQGLQNRFELPAIKGATYSDAYLAFLRKIVYCRTLNVSEETLLKLWNLEKKLLTLMHADSTGSATWFLDACGSINHSRRRLLLTNFDMGIEIKAQAVQLGLNFTGAAPELFDGREMGEDALRVLGQYLKLFSRIQAEISSEIPLLKNATRWASRFDS